MSGERLYACIEAGGTKVIAALIRSDRTIVERVRFPTTTPDETLEATFGWLSEAGDRHGGIAACGIASFGPLELDRAAPNWGHITRTTKPGWTDTDIAGRAGDALGVPVAIDSDVNGAALAEARWGAGQGQAVSIYITVGTGVGGGAVVASKPLHGLSHPEMGHIRLARHKADLEFAGSCPFHGDCLEGLAAGPSIIARWGASLSQLGRDHSGHGIVAHYLAQLAINLQAMMEPGRIIFGGGVMGTPGLLDRVRDEAARLGGGYFRGDPREIVVAPALGDQAGIYGALALAIDALGEGANQA